ncbi:hypothetical protein G7Y89_g3966 [Cudoniella acicularis]|uniref:Peptidase A1 domain-containing protein n=1 Tax=Cudoniella acicularis TaxID=354080 RepID=A0A8H4RSG0_9HELO|nr:hypothetical protein G7Y89_g3966 [Cudoniella acicularis]
MARLALTFGAGIFIAVDAVIYQIPLGDHYKSISQTSHIASQHAPNQYILTGTQTNNRDQNTPIKDAGLILYSINTTLGTPPQPFPMAIDLQWSTLFAPSADCHSTWCDQQRDYLPSFPTFNSSASSSYSPSEKSTAFEYAGMHFSGPISNDTFSFGSMLIETQPFLEARNIRPGSFFHWYFDYSGVIGLSHGESEKEMTPSPWKKIVDENVLDHNLFSIELPHGPRDLENPRTNGALIMGGVDPRYSNASFFHLPLSESEGSSSWSVEVKSLTWGDGKSLHQDFNITCTAQFSTTSPWIWLLGSWAEQLEQRIGAKEHVGPFLRFPCENREVLPDLSFKFKGGEMISLSPFEYSFEMIAGPGDNFVSVFDQDEKEVRLARLDHT